MRGFAELPHIPSMGERFGLRPVALAVYPDYKGVSRLVGMDAIEGLGNLDDQGRGAERALGSIRLLFRAPQVRRFQRGGR